MEKRPRAEADSQAPRGLPLCSPDDRQRRRGEKESLEPLAVHRAPNPPRPHEESKRSSCRPRSRRGMSLEGAA